MTSGVIAWTEPKKNNKSRWEDQKMTKIVRNAFAIVSLLVLSACVTTGVKPLSVADETQVAGGQKIGNVEVQFSRSVEEKLKGDNTIKLEPFKETLGYNLSSNGLLNGKSGYTLHVKVTEVRFRSTFNAVMWGFMSGNDYIVGNVTVKDPTGKSVRAFEVSASYALGGFGGGQAGVRLGSLYEEFGRLTAAELQKGPSETVVQNTH